MGGGKLIGKVLKNRQTGKRYKILDLFYEGSMARIYLARDLRIGTDVIVKAIKYTGTDPEVTIPKRRKEALWEAKLLMKIHDALSSAVPQVIDVLLAPSQDEWVQSLGGKWREGEPYLILEKISGKNLAELDLPLPLEGALTITLNIALFLHLLHRTGYVYQSLTPENVILGEDGWNVTMLDLDSAAPIHPHRTPSIELTEWKKQFLPPRLSSHPSLDIYSLGALLHYLLTGAPPSGTDTSLFQSLPLKVRELIQKCLAPEKARFTSAEMVAFHIEHLLRIRKIPILLSFQEKKEKPFPIPKGTLLNQGTYKILEGLSTGGQGRVYIAENTLLGCKVLIKTPFYPRDLCSLSPKEQETWVKETHEILQMEKDMLAHFHTLSSIVPQPLDFFWDTSYESTDHLSLSLPLEKAPYLVIEYIQGTTLDVVAKLSVEEAFRIGDRLCHILSLFHKEHYIYQDLKLSNIMIDERGQNIYLIDLGSLCKTDPKTGHPLPQFVTYGTYTPGYRAPEWAKGAKYCDYRSDIYTIGATLWALISGKSPADYFKKWEEYLFQQKAKGDIGTKTFREKLIEAESPRLPLEDLKLTEREKKAGAEEVIAKALALHPKDRYSSAEEMREDIQRVLAKLRQNDEK